MVSSDGRRLGLVAAMVAAAVVSAASFPGRQADGGPSPAYLLVELPSGRTLAQSGGDVLDTPVAPGSIAKIATLAAALESGAATDATRILCRRRVDVDNRVIDCVHPDLHRPLDPAEALGYSCNVYFATIARTLSREALSQMFVRLGLPPLQTGAPTVSGALGLAGIRATPRHLLEAFLRAAGASTSPVRLRDTTRAVLRRGLELAARTGTASALGDAGFRGLAKTGTAPMPGGGYEGLVTALVDTELPTRAIVVVAPGANGAYAAELAAGILKAHGVPSRKRRSEPVAGPGAAGPGVGGMTRAGARSVEPVQPAVPSESRLRVGTARSDGSYAVSAIDLESYVARAVAGEGGDALPRTTLEALAIVARTFAEKNRGRHQAEGFDLCDLTHCLALQRASSKSVAAARATRGLLLFDGTRLADLYLSASCGGQTERPSLVWAGARDPSYLPSQPDPACGGEPRWESEVPEPELRRALQAAGLRGGPVRDLRVAARSMSGRARELRVEGMVPDHVDAGAFRLAAGRVLGWQVIKSTLFDIERTGAGYRFTGRGLGHGVGLCVRGAAARAGNGESRDAILAFYFPGLRIGSAPASLRIVLPEEDRPHLPELRRQVSAALEEIAGRLGVAQPVVLEVRFHPSVEAFGRAAGQPWWTAGRAAGTRIDVLPFDVLRKRGILVQTLRHEIAHVLTDDELAGRPLWVREGLAEVMAGDVPPDGAEAGRLSCPSDQELRDRGSERTWRDAYARAARCVADALAEGRAWRDIR